MDTLLYDLRFAVRLLLRDRRFTVTAVLVLALGIGVNNMLFTIVNAHTIRGLPIKGVDRMVYVSNADNAGADLPLSYPDLTDIGSSATTVIGLAAFQDAPLTVSGDDLAAERLNGAYVSSSAFALIGVSPTVGREFLSSDDVPGAPVVAVLSERVWRTRYAADPAVLSRRILANGTPATVVGVLPDRSGLPSTAQVWLPLHQSPGLSPDDRSARNLRVFGRLKEGATLDDARADFARIAKKLAGDYPETNKGIATRIIPINERFLGKLTDPAWMAFLTAGFLIVLISCANVANLMLARSFRRTREIGVRRSLGATRGRVIRQLLIEGGTLAALGGSIGLLIAIVGVRLFRQAIPDNALPYWFDYSTDWRVVVALVAVSAATVVMFALLPAVHTSKTDVNQVLKDGAHAAPSRQAARRWTTGLMAAEFGLSIVLLAQLSVSVRIANQRIPSDSALESSQVLVASILLPANPYKTAGDRLEFLDRLAARMKGLPVVSAVSVASTLPLSGGQQRTVVVQNGPVPDSDTPKSVRTIAISPGYFETLGLSMARGRDFVSTDGDPGQLNAIVNEQFVRETFGGNNPIGRRIALGSTTGPPSAPPADSAWVTIVGVGPDLRQQPANGGTPLGSVDPVVYVPYRSTASPGAVLLLRGSSPAEALVPRLKEEAMAIDPNLPLFRVQSLAHAMHDADWNGHLSQTLLLALVIIAVALTTLGTYASTAHTVTARTREIGLRVALGARPLHVTRLVFGRVFLQLALGFVSGVIGIVLWDRAFSAGRVGFSAMDPWSLVGVAILLTVAASAACVLPTRRATRLDPMTAIRRD